MISIINAGFGNTKSVFNMLKWLEIPSKIITHPKEILDAKKLILPGVGSYDLAMKKLHELDLVDSLNEKVLMQKTPILGICLGMQLMTKSSEEGEPIAGLGWIDGKTVRFSPADSSVKVPHMGWNELYDFKASNPLFKGFKSPPKFYFVHSYHVVLNQPNQVTSSALYDYRFCSSFNYRNISAVQFHPEKSHKYGMKVLKNFSEIKNEKY